MCSTFWQSEAVERQRITAVNVHGLGDAEDEEQDLLQAWTRSSESSPDGTIPVRRTTEDDVLRASAARRFGMKPRGGTPPAAAMRWVASPRPHGNADATGKYTHRNQQMKETIAPMIARLSVFFLFQ
jgi:hypothetical protein